jgi:hypothetical protein
MLHNREEMYKNFPTNKLKNSSEILLFYGIENNLYAELQEKIKNFLLKSLSLVYGDHFEWSDNFLIENENLINSLPNKTPNGIINPKKETLQEFTDIHTTLIKILENSELSSHIEKMIVPNIRYKSPNETFETKTRPYYTGKLHSDAWVGHQGDSQILIGCLGDISNNTVEFYKPIDISDNYLHKAESFEEGNTRYSSLEYIGKLESDELCVMDHYCIHRTLINDNSGPRISLDVAAMFDSEFSHSNDIGFDENMYNYYDIGTMESIGEEKYFQIDDSIFDSKKTTIKII